LTLAPRKSSSIPGAPASGQVFNVGAVTLQVGVPQVLDFTAAKQSGMDAVRGAFVDNTANAAPCYVITASGDVVVVPPYSAVQRPVAQPSDQFTMTIAGAGQVNVNLFNYQVPALISDVTLKGVPQVNGVVPVSDAALEAAMNQGSVRSQAMGLGTGDVIVPRRVGDQAFSGTKSTAGAVTIVAGAPSFFVTALEVGFTPDTFVTAGGFVTVSCARTSDGQVLFSRKIGVPSMLGTVAMPISGVDVFEMVGLDYCGLVNGSTQDNLQLTLGTALTGGALYWTALGGYTNLGG
jgi:hypothetical protein